MGLLDCFERWLDGEDIDLVASFNRWWDGKPEDEVCVLYGKEECDCEDCDW